MKEYVAYLLVKSFGRLVRILPASMALFLGKFIGITAYYVDIKHRTQAYGNLKTAFAKEKSFDETKALTKRLFMNFGQNIVEMLRMPLLTKESFHKQIETDGQEHIDESLKKGKGVILLAMHFGSWELASVSCAMLGYDYKVFVKPQSKYTKLNELLNWYRSCSGSVVLSRGVGTRDLVKSLQNNQVIGMVVDQGGRDGTLVPLFGRQASMSVGAIRLALKMGTPVCFSVIVRGKNGKHCMVIEKPMELINTGDTEKDVEQNLTKIAERMEHYIRENPDEYMWFYKMWKYSKESKIAILSDGKIGHLRHSQCTAQQIEKALDERDMVTEIVELPITFKSNFHVKIASLFSVVATPVVLQGRLGLLRFVLTKKSFDLITRSSADFFVSCGSSIAGINYCLARDQNAKCIVNLTPGGMSKQKFDLIIMPEHDKRDYFAKYPNIVFTKGAPNIVNKDYLEENVRRLEHRFSHLKSKVRFKIGVFIGGSSKNVFLTEYQIKVLLRQIREVCNELNADMMITTSRRTPLSIEKYIKNQFRKDDRCILCVLANEQDVPEAMGGILGLSDIVIVSGDSISMVSEAASSGKQTIVFLPKFKEIFMQASNKHKRFIKSLDKQGYVLSTSVRNIGQTIYNIAKSKVKTRVLDDDKKIFEAAKKVI